MITLTHLPAAWYPLLLLALGLAAVCIFVHELCRCLFFPPRGYLVLRLIIVCNAAASATLAYAAWSADIEGVLWSLSAIVILDALKGPYLWHLGLHLNIFLRLKSGRKTRNPPYFFWRKM
jgi:hypothetical protein